MNVDVFQGPITPERYADSGNFLIDVLWERSFMISVTDINGTTVIPQIEAELNRSNHVSVFVDNVTHLPIVTLGTTKSYHEFRGVVLNGQVFYPMVTSVIEGTVLHITIEHKDPSGRTLVTQIWVSIV